jgi:5'-deoxynucleotidase YfbR-like HD superfamily hydrolase
MLSGRRLNLADPSPFDIEIEDIAHGLSRVARWNGQTSGAWAYSVAQHSVLVEQLVSSLDTTLARKWRLAALLHDGPEYVIGDMITPFKAIIGPDYKTVDRRLIAAIHMRFGLPPELPVKVEKLIKRADRVAAYLEATQIARFDVTEARKIFGAPRIKQHITIDPIAPEDAKARYLERFRMLGAGSA